MPATEADLMGPLSLRARLLAGLAAVAIVLVAAAWAIAATTRSLLTDQLDDQLVAAADPARGGRLAPGQTPAGARPGASDPPADAPERLSPLFEGFLAEDGRLEALFEPNLPGLEITAPDVDWVTASASAGQPFTVESIGGETSYRVLTRPAEAGFAIRALPLTDVEETVGRLILLEAVGLATVLAVLVAVAWWVIRLGLRPIDTMTRAAMAIGDDDLTARVPEQATGTEAGTLARAINLMLGRIETAVNERRHSEDRLRRFVADASHELRTPVTTIRGYAELYRHGGLGEQGALDDAMRRTEQEATRMSRLVEDMLTLAKLDRQRPTERAEVDLSRLVADTVADAGITAPDHELRGSIAPDLVVVGDEDRLRQVLVNLIGNATAHTPAGTTVSIRAERHGADAVVEVVDDGPGIEAEHLSRITERFYRADRSRSRAGGGSGLGLAIAESVVEAHGGSLTIASETGRGTIVTLRLPGEPGEPGDSAGSDQ